MIYLRTVDVTSVLDRCTVILSDYVFPPFVASNVCKCTKCYLSIVKAQKKRRKKHQNIILLAIILLGQVLSTVFGQYENLYLKENSSLVKEEVFAL